MRWILIALALGLGACASDAQRACENYKEFCGAENYGATFKDVETCTALLEKHLEDKVLTEDDLACLAEAGSCEAITACDVRTP